MSKRIIFTALALLWMGVIFFFSSQDGKASGELSGGIVDSSQDTIFGDDFYEKPIEEQDKIHHVLNIVVRKGAHITVFGILALLVFLALYSYKKSYWMFLISLGFSFLYACSDEFHQTFVKGRCGLFSDVLIDTAGVIIFLSVTFLIVFLINRKKKEKNL